MMLDDQVYAQTLLLAGAVESEREETLRVLCRSAVTGLSQRLREGLTAEDCKADFIAAAALYALAALTEIDQTANMERVQFGDVTLVSGDTSAASRCLRKQADIIIEPYCRDRFLFRGV